MHILSPSRLIYKYHVQVNTFPGTVEEVGITIGIITTISTKQYHAAAKSYVIDATRLLIVSELMDIHGHLMGNDKHCGTCGRSRAFVDTHVHVRAHTDTHGYMCYPMRSHGSSWAARTPMDTHGESQTFACHHCLALTACMDPPKRLACDERALTDTQEFFAVGPPLEQSRVLVGTGRH